MIYIESCIALAAIKKVNIKSNNTCGIRAKRIPRIPFHSYVRINKAQENPMYSFRKNNQADQWNPDKAGS